MPCSVVTQWHQAQSMLLLSTLANTMRLALLASSARLSNDEQRSLPLSICQACCWCQTWERIVQADAKKAKTPQPAPQVISHEVQTPPGWQSSDKLDPSLYGEHALKAANLAGH